jgi:peptidoglycan/LPS O-acetylase OafA/YrhL
MQIEPTNQADLNAAEPRVSAASQHRTGVIAKLFSSPEGGKGHFLLIDVMRGFAALVVIFWHYQHFFYPPGATRAVPGFRTQQPFFEQLSHLYLHSAYAVQLFWVISGFVFAHVYHGRRSTTRGFVVNRVARLYPLHLLTLLIVAGLQLVAQIRFGDSLVYQANSLGNFLLQLGLASNWWPDVVYSFNAPIWSVSIEVLIYALFWLVLPILFRAGIVLPLLVMAGSMFASFRFEGYILFTCAACFFGGAAMFALHSARATWLALVAVAALALLGYLGWEHSLDVRRYLAVPLIGMGLVLAAALTEQHFGAGFLRRFRWLGDASYGIYLWHFPIQLVLLLTVPGLATDHEAAPSPVFLILFLCTVVSVAVLSYNMIEKPARHWVRRVLEVGPTGS